MSATAVLLDPRTGDVLAMGSFPDYDPSAPGRSPAAPPMAPRSSST